METIDRQKIEAYIEAIGDDLETLKSLQTDITSYKDKITAEIVEQLEDNAAEIASLSSPFTYIAFKAKQLASKVEKTKKLQETIGTDILKIINKIETKKKAIEQKIAKK